MTALADMNEMFVSPVPDHEDIFAFRYGFTLEGKALEDGTDSVVTEVENGDLIIEGWAADFGGIDRQKENFVPGAFERGRKAFLEGQAALCFHHKHDHGIGTVLDLSEREIEGKAGLWMRARVDHQPESSPLRYIYNAIKKGSYKGLSVGGFFKRALTAAGYRIADMDFTEVSVTPVAVHPGTSFNVVAGKALEDIKIPEGFSTPIEEGEIRAEDEAMLRELLEMLERTYAKIGQRVSPETDNSITSVTA